MPVLGLAFARMIQTSLESRSRNDALEVRKRLPEWHPSGTGCGYAESTERVMPSKTAPRPNLRLSMAPEVGALNVALLLASC